MPPAILPSLSLCMVYQQLMFISIVKLYIFWIQNFQKLVYIDLLEAVAKEFKTVWLRWGYLPN